MFKICGIPSARETKKKKTTHSKCHVDKQSARVQLSNNHIIDPISPFKVPPQTSTTTSFCLGPAERRARFVAKSPRTPPPFLHF